MKNFFGGVFIDHNKLREAGIEHPIKVEYYKIINEDEVIKSNGQKYGVQIVKTEYIEENVNVEKNEIKHITNDEKDIENILQLLKTNEVTPISLQDIIVDLKSKQTTCQM